MWIVSCPTKFSVSTDGRSRSMKRALVAVDNLESAFVSSKVEEGTFPMCIIFIDWEDASNKPLMFKGWGREEELDTCVDSLKNFSKLSSRLFIQLLMPSLCQTPLNEHSGQQYMHDVFPFLVPTGVGDPNAYWTHAITDAEYFKHFNDLLNILTFDTIFSTPLCAGKLRKSLG